MGSRRKQVEIGATYGPWEVIAHAEPHATTSSQCVLRCTCGRTRVYRSYLLRQGMVPGCVCRGSRPGGGRFPVVLPVGATYHFWTVLGPGPSDRAKQYFSWVQCRCGEVRLVRNWSLRTGYSKGCGCPYKRPRGEPTPHDRTQKITREGIALTLTEWCERLGMKLPTVMKRMQRGMSVEEALTLPLTGQGGYRPRKPPVDLSNRTEEETENR